MLPTSQYHVCPDSILKQRADHALQLFAERIRKSTASKWLAPWIQGPRVKVTPSGWWWPLGLKRSGIGWTPQEIQGISMVLDPSDLQHAGDLVPIDGSWGGSAGTSILQGFLGDFWCFVCKVHCWHSSTDQPFSKSWAVFTWNSGVLPLSLGLFPWRMEWIHTLGAPWLQRRPAPRAHRLWWCLGKVISRFYEPKTAILKEANHVLHGNNNFLWFFYWTEFLVCFLLWLKHMGLRLQIEAAGEDLRWWSPSWLNLAAEERPQTLMNFLPELSNVSRDLMALVQKTWFHTMISRWFSQLQIANLWYKPPFISRAGDFPFPWPEATCC